MVERDQTEQEQELLEILNLMSNVNRDKFIRLIERLAKKPDDLHLSFDLIEAMLDTDSDIPLH